MLVALGVFASMCSSRSSRLFSRWLATGWRSLAVLPLSLCLTAHAASPSTGPALPAAPAALQVCAACHGAQGAGNASGVPRIAGMNADYLAHNLAAFKAGTRSSAIMQPIARTLSDADIDALAKYFAAQHPPLAASSQTPSPDRVAAGKAMAMHGDGTRIAACFSCHAIDGRGQGEHFPGIAGEPAVYVVNRLHEFQSRARLAPPKPGTMTELAAKLTETDIQNAAAYLSSMPVN